MEGYPCVVNMEQAEDIEHDGTGTVTNSFSLLVDSSGASGYLDSNLIVDLDHILDILK